MERATWPSPAQQASHFSTVSCCLNGRGRVMSRSHCASDRRALAGCTRTSTIPNAASMPLCRGIPPSRSRWPTTRRARRPHGFTTAM